MLTPSMAHLVHWCSWYRKTLGTDKIRLVQLVHMVQTRYSWHRRAVVTDKIQLVHIVQTRYGWYRKAGVGMC